MCMSFTCVCKFLFENTAFYIEVLKQCLQCGVEYAWFMNCQSRKLVRRLFLEQFCTALANQSLNTVCAQLAWQIGLHTQCAAYWLLSNGMPILGCLGCMLLEKVGKEKSFQVAPLPCKNSENARPPCCSESP